MQTINYFGKLKYFLSDQSKTHNNFCKNAVDDLGKYE